MTTTLATKPKLSPAEKKLLKDIGKRVKFYRSEIAITQAKLAEASDMSHRYIAQLERGLANISIILLTRIAKALDVHVNTLTAPQQKQPVDSMFA